MYPIFPMVAVCCISLLVHAAPQGNPNCAAVPVNPDAGEIGAQYLAIPGCGGDSGGNSGGNSGTLASSGSSTDSSSAVNSPVPSNANTGAQQEVASSPVSSTASSSSTSTSSSSGGSSAGGSSSKNSSISSNNTASSSSGIGAVFKSSITRYGQGPPGTPGTDKHCQGHEGSCGDNPQSGWTAAASQFLYFNGGSGTGGGQAGSPGAACGTCWKVTGATDGSNAALSPPATPIVVLITNECAAQDPGQPVNLCGMGSLTETNSLDANVNIDLCMDSGAAKGFFAHPAPWGTAVGTAQQVNCASEWCGVWSNGTKSGPAGCQPIPADYADTT